jgi:Tol biopolymer transport system component
MSMTAKRRVVPLRLGSALILVLALVTLALAAPGDQAEPGLPLKAGRTLTMTLTEGTWMSVDVAPDGQSLVFDLLGDLYALDARGGDARRLTSGLAFDSQPTFSPDGKWIAFVSDRSGNENVWIAAPSGAEARQISQMDDNTEFISPEWSADGRFVYVSRIKPDLNVAELWCYDTAGGQPTRLTIGKSYDGQPKDSRYSVMGVTPSHDGRYLYYATRRGGYEDHVTFPLWNVTRRDIASGNEEVVVTAQGSAMRPVLAPDGRHLAYATRLDGETGLRLRDLETGDDRWLAYPAQHDQQEAWPSRDLMPGYAFTPDGSAVIYTYNGKFHRVEVSTGAVRDIPFTAHVALEIGPSQRLDIPEDTGPVRARLIQAPANAPDGRRVAFSALGRVYVMSLDGTAPRRLTRDGDPEFQPSWSPDARELTYVTWTASGGHVWRAAVDGSTPPRRLTEAPAFYTEPVFTPDGQSVIALRSSAYARNHTVMEFGNARQADVVRIPGAGGRPAAITSGWFGTPQFTSDPSRLFLISGEGLVSMRLDGTDLRRHVSVRGPGYYFQEGTVPVDDLRISPDGKWALAQIVSQAYLVELPPLPAPGAPMPVVDLTLPGAHRRLTTVGADFIGWADQGRTITWAVGSTICRESLEAAQNNGPGEGKESFPAVVEMPRDTPSGTVVLRGATAITMRGDEVIEHADVVVSGNTIVAVGPRGRVPVPAGATIRDVTGKYVVPGFVDPHAHWADIRRTVLEWPAWGFLMNLAHGVTAGLDPSTLTIDQLAYQDLIDAGVMLGPRGYSTATAVFSSNEFRSLQETVDVVRRYRDHYRVGNLKEYRTGNRRQREWVAQAVKQLGIMPTTEGAVNMKLDLTQALDGFAGNEHALAAVPLSADTVQLFAQSRMAYTPTLVISNGGPPGYGKFVASRDWHADPKVQRFVPHFFLDAKLQRGRWVRDGEFLYPRLAQGAAAIQRAGGLVGVGSHGEFQGLSYHWEMWALAEGGMTPREILEAATIGSAEVIGRRQILGSLEAGKLADLIVLDKNPLDDIHNAMAIRQVMKNGRLYDAATLDEVYPRQRPLSPLWFWADHPAPSGR